MSLPKRIPWIRVIAIVACLLASGVYFTFTPTRTLADEATCTCGGGLDGKCDGGQRCVCLFNAQTGLCTNCVWNDDRSCKGELE